MEDKEFKKVVKHILTAYERTIITANKIDRCFGGRNDILKPVLDELEESLNISTVSEYSLQSLLNEVASGDLTVKEAANEYMDNMRG